MATPAGGVATGGVTTFERQTLPNGARLLTAPMANVQSTSCFLMFAAGSRYETAQSNGIAHFAEHMFFKGTERRPTARHIAGEIDSIGGEFNAFTGKEYTGYYVRCAAEHAPVAFDVLVDMIRHSKFDPEEIEREKGVIIEEMNMYFDTPRDYLSGLYEQLVYGDQPLGWDIIGRKQTVREATRETFLDYLDRWYKPSRLVIGVGGKLDDSLLERVEELATDFQPGDSEGPDPAVLNGNSERVRLQTKQSDQAHVTVGVRSYPLVHPDRYPLQLLSTILGGGMSSRLFTEVRERRGLAYYVYGINNSYTDAGSLFAQAGVDINRIDEAVETIVGELRRIADESVPADELEKARNFTKGRFVLQLESPHGTIQFGLRREVLEGRTAEPTEVLEELDAVTAEDVQRVAQDLIGEKRLYLAAIGPFEDPERFEKLLA
jgi:predicted Zn-dependent peptidase